MPKEKVPHKCLSMIMLDCYWIRWEVLSSNIFRRMQIYTRKDKIWEL